MEIKYFIKIIMRYIRILNGESLKFSERKRQELVEVKVIGVEYL